MPENPFSRDPAVNVGVGADTSGLQNAFSDAQGATTALGGTLTTLGSILVGGAAVAGIGVAAAMGKATQAASEFESAMADVAKVTSTEVAANLEDDIMALSEEIPVARSELTKLAEQAGKFGVEGEKNIANFVETAGKMATAMDLPADELGRRMAKIAQATETPISEVDKLGNAVNSLADSMKTDASEITNTAQRAGIALSNRLGLGTDQALALSAAMNEVSPTARRAGGSLRKMASSLMDPKKTEDLAAALNMTPEAFREMRDEEPQKLMERIATGLEGSGEQSRELASALGKRGVESFSRFAEAIEGTDEALATVNRQFENGTSLEREMELRTNTLQGQMQLLDDTINNVATGIGQSLLPGVRASVTAFRNGVTASRSFFSEIQQGDGSARILGTISTRFSEFEQTIQQAFSGNLSAAVDRFVNNSLRGLGEVASALFGGGGEGGGMIDTALAKLTTWLQTKGVELSRRAWGAFGGIVRGILIEIRNLLSGGRSSIIGQGVNRVVSYLRTEARGDLETAAGIAWDGIVAAASSFLGELTGEGSDASIQDSVSTIVGWLKEQGKNLLKSAASAAWSAITDAASDAVGAAVTNDDSVLKTAISDAKSWLTEKGPGILKQGAEAAWSEITSAGETAAGKLITNEDSVLKGLVSDVQSYLKNEAKSDTKSAMKALFDGLGDAAGNAFQAAFNAAVPNSIKIPEQTLGQNVPGFSATIGGVSLDLPQLDTGGRIERSGLAMVHRGEQVVPAAEVDPSGGATTINIDRIEASSYQDGRQAIRGIRDEVESHGV